VPGRVFVASVLSPLRHRWRADGGYRHVLALALPLILSTGSSSLQGFINRMFLIWSSPEALAASMPAGILSFAILSIFINTSAYVGTFVAQYHGAGQNTKVGPITWQAGVVALAGALLSLLLIPAAPAFFAWVGHDPAVQVEEVTFFRILCLSAFPTVMAAAFSGMISGLGRTRTVMWVSLATTAFNIALDYVLILGRLGVRPMGIAGAGWSAVVVSTVQAAIYVCIVCSRRYRDAYHTLDWRPDATMLRALVRFGLPSGIQFFVDIGGFTAFILLVGRIGKNELAATNLAFNVNSIAFMPIVGLGIAVSVLVGQAMGRGEPEKARYRVRSAAHLTLTYMVLIAALFVLLPKLFLSPFAAAADPEEFAAIGAIAVVLLRFVAVYTTFDGLNIVFSSAIKGAGDTRFVMVMIFCLSMGVLVVPSFAAIHWFGASIYLCWSVATAYVISLGLAFYLRYRSGVWTTMRVIER